MSLPASARYLLIALLVVVSFLPQLLVVGIFGDINLLFLAALWALLFLCFLKAPKGLAVFAAVIGALVMAIPPVPNYVWPGKHGLNIQFVGWNDVLEGGGLYGIVFFFMFYLIVFGVVAWLMNRRVTQDT